MSRTEKKTTEEFLLEIKERGVWNDDYDYSLVEYKGKTSKVVVVHKLFQTKHLFLPKNLLEGQKCSTRNLVGGKNGYRDVDDALKFIHSLNLKNTEEWLRFRKSDKLPFDIPTKPRVTYGEIYKRKYGEVLTMGKWLGTNSIQDGLQEWVEFDEYLKFARSLNFKTQHEWFEYVKKNELPKNYPKTPTISKYKKHFKGFPHFLGYNLSYSKEKFTYSEAKDYLKDKRLTLSEWETFINSTEFDGRIPKNPRGYYKNKGWESWPLFLNYSPKTVLGNKLSFEESRKIIRNFNLKGQGDFRKLSKTKEFPKGVPKNPEGAYEEFTSWSDFLGYIGDGKAAWTKQAILSFINSIKDELMKLDSIELITIINSNNLAKKIKDLGFLEDLVSSKSGTTKRENILSKIQNQLQEDFIDSEVLDEESDQIDENLFKEELSIGEDTFYDNLEESEELQDFKPLEQLKFYDNKLITSSLDDENIDFLLKNQLKKLWNNVLNKEVSIEEILNENGGDNFEIIKNNFIKEYNEISHISPPKDYVFKYPPNMMQKLVTYRLKQEKLYGNWSGTGAGKTLSSIFSGRYIGLKNTIIVCNNSTISGWINSIHEYFSNSKVYTKSQLNDIDVSPSKYQKVHKYDISLDEDSFNYIVLNYETFQLGDGEFIVSELLMRNNINYIILDEVQNVKQRSEKEESSRRSVINKLIIHSRTHNPDLHLMVMSATPVINNLVEPKKLIELITGEVHDELDTKSSISNGIEMYKSLTRYGIRYKPKYGISVEENLIEVNGDSLVDQLKKVPKGSPIGFEKVLLKTKLESVSKYLTKGSLIYSHYVTDLVDEIGKFIEEQGFTFGFYIGEDKEGLRRFKNKEIDILIGSSPVGTGVDGIQYVCNTLVPLILPWTSSEYEQLLGRINRQGSNFDKVKVYIPQVVVSMGDKEWSWDKRRYNIIKFKSTLADLAMDGIIPKELSPPRSTLVQQAQEELEEWIQRISMDNIITIEREEIKIPLNPKQVEYRRKSLGDFSELNKNWSISNSKTIYERLKRDKSEWEYYHTLYREKRKDWSEIPYLEISKKIKDRVDWVVADLGCGENLLSKEIPNTIYSFDYIAIDDSVIECDISKLPLQSNKVDVSVFSLALMGSNYVDYLREGSRILKPYGTMFIAEPKKKWENNLDRLISELENIGIKVIDNFTSSRFLYIQGIKLK